MLKKCVHGLYQALLIVAISVAATEMCRAETIHVNPAAQYFSGEVGTYQVRHDCHFDSDIIDSLVHYSRHLVEVTESDLSTLTGKTLRVIITSVHVSGGGGFSGPKWGNLRVQLFGDGKLLKEFDVNAYTTGGKPTACATAHRIAKVLGARAAKRLMKLAVQDNS